MNNRNKKRALIASITSLVLCVAMLLSTTYAWFTCQVSNDGNRIKTGILGVELWKFDATDYINISTEETQGNIFTEDTIWEPGYTQIVFLQVKNTGSLALNYNILLDIDVDEGNTANLANVLDYAIVSGAKATDDVFQDLSTLTWAAVAQMGETGTIGDAMNEDGLITAAPNGALLPNESDYFALAVHMDEEAGNEYQECGITIGVDVVAEQMPHETDCFGKYYDNKDELEPQEPAGPIDVLGGLGNMESPNQSIWVYASASKNRHGKVEFVQDEGAQDGSCYMKLANSTDGCYYSGCTNASHANGTSFTSQCAHMRYENLFNSLQPNTTYTLKFWVKQSDVRYPVDIQIKASGVDALLTTKSDMADILIQNDTWYECSFEFTTPSTVNGYWLDIWTNNSSSYAGEAEGDTVCIDNIRIYEVTE